MYTVHVDISNSCYWYWIISIPATWNRKKTPGAHAVQVHSGKLSTDHTIRVPELLRLQSLGGSGCAGNPRGDQITTTKETSGWRFELQRQCQASLQVDTWHVDETFWTLRPEVVIHPQFVSRVRIACSRRGCSVVITISNKTHNSLLFHMHILQTHHQIPPQGQKLFDHKRPFQWKLSEGCMYCIHI